MDRILRLLVNRGLRRGLLGNSPLWTLIGLAALALRLLKRSRNRLVFSEKIQPGEEITIVHRPATSRARRGSVVMSSQPPPAPRRARMPGRRSRQLP